MMNVMNFRTCQCMLAFCVMACPALAQEPGPTHVKDEMSAAARLLEDRFGKARASFHVTPPKGTEKKQVSEEGEFALDHGLVKVAVHRGAPDGASDSSGYDYVYCVGKDWLFQIEKPSGSKDFHVEKTGADASDRAAYTTNFGRFLKAHIGVAGMSLADLFSRADLRFVKAERVLKANRPLTKAVFEIGEGDARATCTVLADQDAGWLVRSSEYKLIKSPGVWFKADVEYGPAVDGIPVPIRTTLSDWNGSTTSWDFKDWSFGSTPKEEFDLKFYGLPDLVDRRRNAGYGLRVWAGGAALLLLAVALMLRKVATNRRLNSSYDV